jgi:hypothetical protein
MHSLVNPPASPLSRTDAASAASSSHQPASTSAFAQPRSAVPKEHSTVELDAAKPGAQPPSTPQRSAARSGTGMSAALHKIASVFGQTVSPPSSVPPSPSLGPRNTLEAAAAAHGHSSSGASRLLHTRSDSTEGGSHVVAPTTAPAVHSVPSSPARVSMSEVIGGFFSRGRTTSRAVPMGPSLATIGEERAFVESDTPVEVVRSPIENVAEIGPTLSPQEQAAAAAAASIAVASAAALDQLIASGLTHVLDEDQESDWREGALDERGLPIAGLEAHGETQDPTLPDAPVAPVESEGIKQSIDASIAAAEGPQHSREELDAYRGGVQVLSLIGVLKAASEGSGQQRGHAIPRTLDGGEIATPPAGLLLPVLSDDNVSLAAVPRPAPVWPSSQSSVFDADEAAWATSSYFDPSAPRSDNRPGARPFLSHVIRCQALHLSNVPRPIARPLLLPSGVLGQFSSSAAAARAARDRYEAGVQAQVSLRFFAVCHLVFAKNTHTPNPLLSTRFEGCGCILRYSRL